MIDFKIFDASHAEFEIQQKITELGKLCERHGVAMTASVLIARREESDSYRNIYIGGEVMPKGVAPYEYYVLSALLQGKYEIAQQIMDALASSWDDQ